MKVRRFTLRAMAMGALLAFVVSGAPVAFAETLPLNASVAGKTFPFPDTLPRNYDGFHAFVWGTVAPQVDVAPIDATRKLNAYRRRIDFRGGANGFALDRAGAIAALEAEMLRRVDDTMTAPIVALPGAAKAPSVVKFGKSILVKLSERRIYLYDNATVVKKYRCAVGMRRYPTPTGTFVIRRKVRYPSWTNPGGSWGRNMPRYIKPGPRNPLGTRALYLYRNGRDTGIRFHGTSNRGSIGHAASHGCMRMKREDVEKFYKQVPLYTTVYIVK